MSIDKRVAVLALIASDDSYRGTWAVGDFLLTYPDSNSSDGSFEPDPIPESLMQSAGLQFYLISSGKYRIAGWSVASSVTDPDTGLGAVIFQNDTGTEAIVAFTGTNGLSSQGLQGWFTDLTLARTQWNERNATAVRQAIAGLRGTDGLPGTFSGTLNFTGQSLGGALAQYALYDYAITRGADVNPASVSLTTFNGLGVLDALSPRPDFQDISTRLSSVQTAHYTIYNDIIHRLGGGYINGAGNTYHGGSPSTEP